MHSWLHFGGATVACRYTYLSWCSLLLLLLFATKVCSRCEPVSLHLSGFELALYRDALMAPFWGRHGCMSLYLAVMVMFYCISLIPLLQFVEIVKKNCCTSAVLNSYSIEMTSWLHFGGATVACRYTYLS